MLYGFEKGSEIRMSRFENRVKDGEPAGISFKLENGASIVPVRIENVFGRAHAYASAAAAAVGVIFGMNLVTISEALANYNPPSSRMRILRGMKETYVIDDSYNASPLAMYSALDTLRDLPAKRKIAVLGDMLEIGKYTTEVHERVGKLAADSANILFTVGPRAKFIAAAAREEGMKKASIYSFDVVEDALKPLRDILRKGDLVLVKGSHAMALEKVVDDIKEVVLPVGSAL